MARKPRAKTVKTRKARKRPPVKRKPAKRKPAKRKKSIRGRGRKLRDIFAYFDVQVAGPWQAISIIFSGVSLSNSAGSQGSWLHSSPRQTCHKSVDCFK